MGGRGSSSSTSGARAKLPNLGAAAMGAAGAQLLGAVGATAAKVLGPGGVPAGALAPLTQAPAGYTSSVSRVVAEDGKLEVYGEVRTVGGGFAGEFGATFSREGGKLIAKTDNVLMAEGHQGVGIGAAVARNLDATYARLGVSEVRLHAAQVGRYTWAKAGYTWSAETGRQMAASYSTWLAKNGHDSSASSVALRGAQALASTPNGKAFLLSDAPNWSGSKTLK